MVHGWDGTSIGFLTNYNTRTTPLDYKLLIMPWRVGPRGVVLPPLFVPIFGWSDRNFRCIIYSRFNEPRKRSKEPRGLFLIIYRTREGRLSWSPSPFYHLLSSSFFRFYRAFHLSSFFRFLQCLFSFLSPFLSRSKILYYWLLLL